MDAPMCRLCKTRHYGLCEDTPSKEDLREMTASIPAKKPAFPRKAPAKKIVSIPLENSTLDEIKALAAQVHADLVKATIHANEPATADTPTDPTPPSWWRAGETPEFCPREPDKTPDERRRWMIEELRLTENGHRFYSSVADEMEAMIAEIEELRGGPKFDKKAYQREYMRKRREAK